jgi:hypothetical protein
MKAGPKLRIGLLAVCATAAVIAVPSSALAHDKKYDTTTTVVVKNTSIVDGQIASVSRCLGARTVSIFTTAGTLISRAQSDAAGKWQAKVKLDKGTTYSAVVSRKRIRKTRKHKHICLGETMPFVSA